MFATMRLRRLSSRQLWERTRVTSKVMNIHLQPGPHPPPRSPAPVFHPTLQSVISSHPAPEKLSPHQRHFAFSPLKKGRTYRTTRKRRRSITVDSLLASAIYRDCTSMSKYRIICAITATEPHAVRAIHRFFFISKHVIRKIFVYLQSVNPLNPEHINNIKTIE